MVLFWHSPCNLIRKLKNGSTTMKKLILSTLLLSTITHQAIAQSSVSFPNLMYSSEGCSETYFKKGRKLNKIMGFTAGAVGVISSTFMPLSAIFILGGLGVAGETGYSYIEENENPSKKKMAPRIRYPFARQYFDITNTLELNKIINKDKDAEVSEYIPMYMDAIINAKKVQPQYKECKSIAKLEGVSKGEIKEVEKNILTYLMDAEADVKRQSPIDIAKSKMANCFLEIEYNETYPIGDLLLLKDELAKTKLMNWRFKSAIRQFRYVNKMANKENKDISAKKYFQIITEMDKEGFICKNTKKPLNRKNLAKEILLKIE